MSAPRSGPGGRGAPRPCAPMSTMCWRCCRSSRPRCKRLNGPPGTYVGHPLIEQLGDAAPECRGGARGALPTRRCCWCCRAAARPKSGAWRRVRRRGGRGGPTLRRARCRGAGGAAACRGVCARRSRPGRCRPRVVIEPEEKHAAFRGARAALAKSGTSTLELALAGIPMVAAYKVSAAGGGGRPRADQAPHRHPRQSGAGRERGPGIPAARLHAGKPGRRAAAAACRQSGAPPPARGLRPP